MAWFFDMLAGFAGVLQWIIDFCANAADGIATVLSGWVSVPASLLGFFNVAQFMDTPLAGFGVVIFVCIGALALRVILQII